MAKDSDARVERADSPDPEVSVCYEIYSPKVGRDVHVVILSEALFGIYTHFYDRRTRPHLANKDSCEGCGRGLHKRWKGYLAAWDRHRGRLCLAEITPEAYLRCPQFELYKGQLRGKTLRLVRAGESKNARVNATIAMYAGSPGSLPPAFNVLSALERIWFAPDKGDKKGG